jgi:hypothetical protein
MTNALRERHNIWAERRQLLRCGGRRERVKLGRPSWACCSSSGEIAVPPILAPERNMTSRHVARRARTQLAPAARDVRMSAVTQRVRKVVP